MDLDRRDNDNNPDEQLHMRTPPPEEDLLMPAVQFAPEQRPRHPYVAPHTSKITR
jgi:hypothetical protein